MAHIQTLIFGDIFLCDIILSVKFTASWGPGEQVMVPKIITSNSLFCFTLTKKRNSELDCVKHIL